MGNKLELTMGKSSYGDLRGPTPPMPRFLPRNKALLAELLGNDGGLSEFLSGARYPPQV